MKHTILSLGLCALIAGCSTLPENPKTIAAGAPGQVDYCVMLLGANLFCINATRTLESE
ncbi:MAG: hypothetical protein HOB01_08285 [Gammaproteobacteria bacterium]|nr:hypothetical protein [Gammaproteobacteria bacterium]